MPEVTELLVLVLRRRTVRVCVCVCDVQTSEIQPGRKSAQQYSRDAPFWTI